MNDTPMDRLRAHLNRHQHREQAFFSTVGLRELLDQNEAMKAQIVRLLGVKSAHLGERLTNIEHRIYMVMRKDLNMRRGKEIAQACHAVIGLGYSLDIAMITLQVDSEEKLLAIHADAEANGVPVCLIRDAGRTEVAPDTPTCLALGPTTVHALATLTELSLY